MKSIRPAAPSRTPARPRLTVARRPPAAALALTLALACGGPPAPAAPDPAPAPAAPLTGPSPAARSLEIRGALEDARTLWEGGDRDAARDRVLVAYQQSFEPMEPLLARLDPAGTLELEYAFGALAVQLGKRGDPMAAQVAISSLSDRVEAAVKAIPPEALPPEVKQAEELLGPPPVAVEARPPRRDLKTYGDANKN